MKRVVVLLAVGISLTAAAPASAQGLGTWERCQQAAYYQLNFWDPTSVARYTAASAACARTLGADLTNFNRIVAYEVCMIRELKQGIKDPIGYLPLVLTSEAWRCTALYLGKDIEVPPNAYRERLTRSQRLTRSERSTRARSRPAPQSTRSRRPSRAFR